MTEQTYIQKGHGFFPCVECGKPTKGYFKGQTMDICPECYKKQVAIWDKERNGGGQR